MTAMRKTRAVIDILAELTPIALPFIFLPLALFLLLSAMAANAQDAGFGDSIRHNVQVQLAAPTPPPAGTLMEGGVGKRSVMATRRYMTDRIRPLVSAGMDSQVGRQGGASQSSGGSTEGSGR